MRWKPGFEFVRIGFSMSSVWRRYSSVVDRTGPSGIGIGRISAFDRHSRKYKHD